MGYLLRKQKVNVAVQSQMCVYFDSFVLRETVQQRKASHRIVTHFVFAFSPVHAACG